LRYTFEWDPSKASGNLRKHGVSFDRAAEVFLDPNALSIFDEEHSEREERWISLGRDRQGSVLVLIHTFLEVSADECKIRIISARQANRREIRQYEEPQR
jgi:uncharacterized DUF497 family protein